MLFDFQQEELGAVLGGKSSIDLKGLHVRDLNEATQFIAGYGFDLSDKVQSQILWDFHRRSIVLLVEKFGYSPQEIPSEIRDPNELKDLRNLLLWVSQDIQPRKRWACAVLRCMHIYVHTDHDLFSSYSDEIQKQILVPLQDCIINEGSGRSYLGTRKGHSVREEQIELLHFQTKPFKTTNSTVVKLLAKSDALALSVFDKIGVRFVTKTLFDSFRVIRFLVSHHLVSFPHVIPDQSRNNLYPFALFKLVCDQIHLRHGAGPIEEAKLEKELWEVFERERDSHQLLNPNLFSGQDYKAIKFIARKLIRTKSGTAFFYPYEIQIMDDQSYSSFQSGPSEHSAYKARQLEAARNRLFQKES